MTNRLTPGWLAGWFIPYVIRQSRPTISPQYDCSPALSPARYSPQGTRALPTRRALVLALSNFLDHTDGELARITGKTSEAGHYYDLASDAIVHILLFVSIGASLMHGPLGTGALFMGILAGVAVAAIFQIRLMISNMTGKDKIEQPNIGLFEIEDVFYLLPLVTFFEMLQPFLIVAVVGAPGFALWTLRDYLRCKRGRN